MPSTMWATDENIVNSRQGRAQEATGCTTVGKKQGCIGGREQKRTADLQARVVLKGTIEGQRVGKRG